MPPRQGAQAERELGVTEHLRCVDRQVSARVHRGTKRIDRQVAGGLRGRNTDEKRHNTERTKPNRQAWHDGPSAHRKPRRTDTQCTATSRRLHVANRLGGHRKKLGARARSARASEGGALHQDPSDRAPRFNWWSKGVPSDVDYAAYLRSFSTSVVRLRPRSAAASVRLPPALVSARSIIWRSRLSSAERRSSVSLSGS